MIAEDVNHLFEGGAGRVMGREQKREERERERETRDERSSLLGIMI